MIAAITATSRLVQKSRGCRFITKLPPRIEDSSTARRGCARRRRPGRVPLRPGAPLTLEAQTPDAAAGNPYDRVRILMHKTREGQRSVNSRRTGAEPPSGYA